MSSGTDTVLRTTSGEKKRVLESDDLNEEALKRVKLSDAYVSNLNGVSDSESEISDFSGKSRSFSGKQTPSTPQSSRDWPSLKKRIECSYPECDKTFNRQAKLRDHLRYHTGERPFVCSHNGCSCSFPRKTHLDRHVKSAHTDVRDYLCSYNGCSKAFSTGTRLRRHEAAHEKRSQFKCEECGREFRKHATLQKHKTTEHLGLKPFICEIILNSGTLCGASFDRASGLNQHQNHVHGHPKYSCTICKNSSDGNKGTFCTANFEFSTYSEFQSHNILEHPPVCTSCGTTWPTVKQLNRHLELEHGIIVTNLAGEAKPTPYMCPEPGCSRAFSKNGNLKVHIQAVHAQARPFVCGSADIKTLNNVKSWDGRGACFRNFKAKSQLEEHIRTIHMGMEHRHKAKRQSRKAVGAESGSNNGHPTEVCQVVGQLTGTAYENKKGRQIPCVVTGCSFTLTREYDLDIHLRSRHGMDENEVQLIRLTRQPPPPFENELQKDDEIFDKSDLLFGDLELAADNGGSFWIGGREENLANEPASDWEAEQAEMQYLIGDGQGWEDDIIIDPALSQDSLNSQT